jgi:predicted anti-sigma-YlaC factor YlaD
MDCDSIRVAISASLDGEDVGVPDEVVRAHLDGCEACRAWQERAHALTRRARLGGHVLDHDLAPRVLAALPVNPPRTRTRKAWLRAALAVVAVAQLAITVPLLLLGHDHDAGAHAAHELGSFDLALTIAFVVGAVRPKLSAGLAWPCCVAALGLAGTAMADLIAGATFGADEAQHLVAIAGALLLFWQARTGSVGVEGSGDAALTPPAHEVRGDDRDSPREAGPVLGPAARREHAA